jgi:hypothetical protein
MEEQRERAAQRYDRWSGEAFPVGGSAASVLLLGGRNDLLASGGVRAER